MPIIFKHLEAGCLQVNLRSTSAQINQLKYTILYTYRLLLYFIQNVYLAISTVRCTAQYRYATSLLIYDWST